jgi:hypothetical protein
MMLATTMHAAARIHRTDDHRQVLRRHRLHGELTHTGQTEDALDDDHAAEQRAEVDSELQ